MSAKILIDADACPVTRLAENIAKQFSLECVLVCDTSHILSSEYSEVITASKGADCADFVLLSLVNKGDAVVTQDYGLAALCLAKGAYALNQNGLEYTSFNIDSLLQTRHIGAQIRRAGHRTKGPRKRTLQQDKDFEQTFKIICERLR